MINVIFKDFNYEISQRQIDFFEKYNKVIQWGRRNPVKFMEDFLGLEFTDHQKYILLSTWDKEIVVWLMSRSSGKALDLDTPVYVSKKEQKNIGELSLGDKILDKNGISTTVTHLNPIIIEQTYEIEFDDKEIIKCNKEHLWDIYIDNILLTVDTEFLYHIYTNVNINIKIPCCEEIVHKTQKSIVDVRKTNIKKSMRCITVDRKDGLFLCGDNYTVTHNSYLSAPYIMTRTLLIPNHHTFIMCPAGTQAQETFSKMEDLAKGKIKSVSGATQVFWEELYRLNKNSDGFTHDKNSYHCEAFNGSDIRTLNSNPNTIVGIRSNLNFYDEAGKINREFFALTKPFLAQDQDFITGKNLNVECYPKQIPSQMIYSSSAESIDSELYDQYRDCALSMIAGSDKHFVCDISCELSLHPMLNGKKYKPLVKQSIVDDAFKKNEFKANREYFNKFDISGGQDALVKRTTIIANSFAFEPIFKNKTNDQIFIITYDPASKLDNSFVLINELINDPEKGYMLKLVNGVNLVEIKSNGDKKIIQKPEQIEKIKQIILNYNGSVPDYDNIFFIGIDAGSGGGGFDIAQFLLKDWVGKDKKQHKGLIDLTDKYLKEESSNFPSAIDKLRLANFTRDKVQLYIDCQDMINQGNVMFPKSLNLKSEMEFEFFNDKNELIIKNVQMNSEEIRALTEIDLLKEELVGIQRTQNGSVIKFDTLPSKKSQGMHDDRSDCCAMACHFLAQLRRKDLLNVKNNSDGFNKLFEHGLKNRLKNPLNEQHKNPFANNGRNPFL